MPVSKPLAYKFCKFAVIVDINKCWQWCGPMTDQGYAKMTIGGKNIRGHRWAYESYIGTVPDGLVLDHLCRNRWCVNPYHLEPVTIGDNVRRGTKRDNLKWVTHCKYGHEFTPENTYIAGSNGGKKYQRICKICSIRRYQESLLRKS